MGKVKSRRSRAQARTSKGKVATATSALGMSSLSAGGPRPSNFHRIGKPDNKPVDVDSAGGLSVDFRSIAFWPVQSSAISGQGILSGNYGHRLGVNYISPQLSNLADVFEYSRIRRLKVTYLPAANTLMGGTFSFFLGQDSAYLDSSVSDWEVAAYTHSLVTTPYMGGSLPEYVYDGPKVWRCRYEGSSGELVDTYQLLLHGEGTCVITSTTGTVEAPGGTLFGHLLLEGRIDFFCAKGSEGTPALLLDRFATSFVSALRDGKIDAELFAKIQNTLSEVAKLKPDLGKEDEGTTSAAITAVKSLAGRNVPVLPPRR